ncbi:MAG: DNA methylase N-4 [Armatimonadetes bacterium]|nr:DNA methylase N-4 [Armatimonadota bacterium]
MSLPTLPYADFIKNKVSIVQTDVLTCDPSEVHESLKDHQRVQVVALVQGTHRALFNSFGLGKSRMQLEAVRLTLLKRKAKRGLIVIPLGMKVDFRNDAKALGITTTFIQHSREVEADGIYFCNYEAIVDGRLDPNLFDVSSLDEADYLRSAGSETFGAMLFGPMQQIPDRFVATATPSPNDYLELIHYAHYLGVMEMGEAKTRFFARNSEKADSLTLLPNMEEEFWHWVASWAIFLQKPSDLGFSDDGYEMPPLIVNWHEVPSNHQTAEPTQKGQGRMFKDRGMGVVEASREKRESIDARLAKMMELRAEDPDAHRIIWHDLEDERRAIEKLIPSVATIYGSQKEESKEAALIGFSEGTIQELAGKPMMIGSGPNFQHHCSWAIFVGIDCKFKDFIQAIHRIYRFLQKAPSVRIDIIHTEAERSIKQTIIRKWKQHDELVAKQSEIIRKYGLDQTALAAPLQQSSSVERRVVTGENWKLVNNDSVLEGMDSEDAFAGMICTSIPFSNQYQYSNSYLDFGHSEGKETFFEQMDYLTPNLFRILKPGRVAAIHVKDRAVPGGMTGLSFTSIDPFHCDVIAHYVKHGFVYCGMRTVVTDVVRENNQTYRLGWTEVCKDSSRMGAGLPEYVLIFRKPQSNLSKGYADERVEKSKDEYTRARWQFDAHGFWRSSGDRLLMPEDLVGLKMKHVFRAFRKHSKETVYDFEHDVAIAEYFAEHRRLPSDFMLLQPQSWHEDVWTDIFRAGTLNSRQASAGRVKHICPLQFDIVKRLIELYSNPGDIVLDPFSGLGTVPREAVKLGRVGHGWELNAQYFDDSVWHLRHLNQGTTLSLFDLLEVGEDENDLPKELAS